MWPGETRLTYGASVTQCLSMQASEAGLRILKAGGNAMDAAIAIAAALNGESTLVCAVSCRAIWA